MHVQFTLPLNFFSSSLTSLTWIFLKALRRRYGTWITTAFLFPTISNCLQTQHQRVIHCQVKRQAQKI
jgi:hypothetical protein